ncbi:hydroxyacid dehydrogenase [Micromonospora sp. WMMD1076]|uniref:hydroxyacid dehydrogenase n=1 Tax=Micromonospora sp. WMMD1076 TaxID=3016103 RepID=UPI00249A5FCE|nr:hydroxyacid dehydrogenase [Micromonospora sp. WMMD1076]WFF06194.1 hydroxyacid dehydrogenase [Micromonospora sp. WMMD1076]
MIPAALLMRADLPDQLFSPADRARLDRLLALAPGTWTSWADASPAALRRTELLVTGWGCPRVGAAELAGLPRLRAVVHTGGSVKDLLDPAVWARGIRVTSSARANAVPVADYTVAMVLLAGKNVLAAAARYRHTLDRRALLTGYPETGNADRTVGLLGASRVGRLVAARLSGLGFRLLCHDPYLDADDARRLGVRPVSLNRLFAEASIVSLHAPLTPDTAGMVGAAELALMPDGGTLINTARAGLLDQDALLVHLRSGRLSAVLDVTDPEPLPLDHPLRELPNVLITPHVAGAQGTELRRLGDQAVQEVERFVDGRPPADPVPAEQLPFLA